MTLPACSGRCVASAEPLAEIAKAAGGELIAQIEAGLLGTDYITARAEKEVLFLGEIDLAASIETGGCLAADGRRRVVEGLYSEGQLFAEVPLQEPARVAPVPVALAGVPPSPVAA